MLDKATNTTHVEESTVVDLRNMVSAKDYMSLAIMSNAIEFATRVVRGVVGEEVAPGFDGESLSETELANLVAAKLQSQVTTQSSGVSS